MAGEATIARQCRAALAALDVADAGATHQALRWGMEMLSGIGSGRLESRESGGDSAAEYDGSSGSGGGKRKTVESIADPSCKAPRMESTSRVLDLKEFLKLVECGKLGQWMADRVASRMRPLDSKALVALIDHCLVLSLDQSPIEGAVVDVDRNHLWLHSLMVREILCYNSTNNDESLIEFPELDWLLGYLAATKPENFLRVLNFRSKDASIVPYARQAGILEFAAMRVPELILPAVILLIQDDQTELQYKIHAWTVQSALSPRFLAAVATALVTRFELETLESFWKSASFTSVPLPAPWTIELDSKLASDGCRTKTWLSVIVLKHWEQLSPVAAELVLLLSKVNLWLLEWLNKRLSSLVMAQLAENSINNKFLQTLLKKKRLWKSLFSRSLASCQCSSMESSAQCRKCYPRDVFLQTCQITLLASDDEAVAEFLLETCSHGTNTEIQSFFATQTQMLGAMGKSRKVLQIWANKIANQLHICVSSQVLKKILAIRQLLDPSFWSSNPAATSWKPLWENVCEALNEKWLEIFAVLHRDEDPELALNTLSVIQSLSTESRLSTRDVAHHLKGALGFLFHLLKKMDDVSEYSLNDARWNYLREAALLRKIIADLGSLSSSSFTLMVTILLNFSFEAGIRRQLGMSSNNDISKVEHIMSKPGFQTTIALASGTVDRYGRMEFVLSKCCKISESVKPDPMASRSSKAQTLNPTFSEICGVLVQTFRKSAAKQDKWSRHPVDILGTLLVNRLETPHDISITMEQYEEVLPKHVSFVRHTFLTECFHQNPLLFKILELVMEHGKAKQLEACAEFVRALLADCISQWHGGCRRQQSATADKSGRDRMQLFNIIQLVTLAQWLPQPLASCGEIISLISTDDVTSLLLIIWRCMHNELASLKNSLEARPDEEKDSASAGRDWETQFLSILRHNVSRIGAHFVRLYPQHKLVAESIDEPSPTPETDQTGCTTN